MDVNNCKGCVVFEAGAVIDRGAARFAVHTDLKCHSVWTSLFFIIPR